MKTSMTKCSVAVSLALIASSISTQTCASGFALIENSASGMGNAFAGASAIADDASTVWFNPAGMTKLSGSRMAIAGHVIMPKAEFTNVNSTMLTGTAGEAPLTGSNQDGGVTKFIPNFYYVTHINSDISFGLGINAPFGLATDYNDDSWIGRYHATKSDMKTININPALAFKASEKFSIGVGFNYQTIDVTLNNRLDAGAICQGLSAKFSPVLTPAECLAAVTPGDTNSSQSLTGDDTSWGVNLGILYDFTDATRLGVAYRSGVNHDLEGNVDFTMNTNFMTALDTELVGPYAPYAALFDDSKITAHTELPDTLSFSLVHNMDTALTLLADATYTRWSSFDQLKIKFENPVQPDSVTPENWSSTWRFAIGANYKASDSMTYRGGVALDQSPIDTPEYRTARIPGNDRTWISLGLGYALNSDMSVDVGYSHLFVKDTTINNRDVASGHTLNGTYDSAVDIMSAQFNMKF